MPFEPEVLDSTPGRAAPASRAGAAPPRSTRPARPARRGRGRRPSRSGRSASATSDSDGCSSRSARLASQTSVGRSSHRQKSIPITSSRAGPTRARARALLLVEVLALDAVRVALERQRAAAQVRQQHGGDARVVVDHLALGEADVRVQDLVEVGQRQPPALDLHLDPPGGHLGLLSWRPSSCASSEPDLDLRRGALLRLRFSPAFVAVGPRALAPRRWRPRARPSGPAPPRAPRARPRSRSSRPGPCARSSRARGRGTRRGTCRARSPTPASRSAAGPSRARAWWP